MLGLVVVDGELLINNQLLKQEHHTRIHGVWIDLGLGLGWGKKFEGFDRL
jgi:hypothetical protein